MDRLTTAALLALAALLPACDGGASAKASVTVYCAHDRIHSQEILELFTSETGIEVKAKWDTEASKTTSLVNALIAEAAAPRCDVFWNNEVSQTIILEKRGLLQPYKSPAAASIPEAFKQADGLWTGFAARARVFIINTELVAEADTPSRLEDLFAPKYRGRIGIARPLFGTTATHAAALFATRGPDKARAFFEGLKANEAVICAGNAQLKDRVVAGELAYGLTDTDDFNLARLAGAKVRAAFPGQGEDGEGTLVIPNAVAILKGAPEPDAARKLVDFLLSERVEELLARSRSAQIPLRSSVPRPDWIPKSLKALSVSWPEVGGAFAEAQEYLQEDFLKK